MVFSWWNNQGRRASLRSALAPGYNIARLWRYTILRAFGAIRIARAQSEARGEWRGLLNCRMFCWFTEYQGSLGMWSGTAICTSGRSCSKRRYWHRIAGIPACIGCSRSSIVGLSWDPRVLSDRLQMRLSPALGNVVTRIFLTLSSR